MMVNKKQKKIGLKEAIKALVNSSVEAFANGFEARHLGEVENPNGTINMQIYQDLFILENIFREYIKIKKINESDLDITKDEEKKIINTIKGIRNLRQKCEERHVLKGKIVKEEHYLNYLDLFYLGEIIDILVHKIYKEKKRKYRKGLELDTKEIEPIRNPIMHTNEITEDVLSWNKIKNVIDYIEKLKDESKK